MSRVGAKPIKIPEEVTAQIARGQIVISGPKGQLKQKIYQEIEVKISDGQIVITRKSEDKTPKSLHGLTRSLIANMIEGVTKGFLKVLQIEGTGYRTNIEGDSLKLKLGFSHPIVIKPPEGIKFEIEGNNIIKVFGIDKQLVGQVAARIRNVHKPDSYKGKGIRYKDEVVKRKAGKVVKTSFGGL